MAKKRSFRLKGLKAGKPYTVERGDFSHIFSFLPKYAFTQIYLLSEWQLLIKPGTIRESEMTWEKLDLSGNITGIQRIFVNLVRLGRQDHLMM